MNIDTGTIIDMMCEAYLSEFTVDDLSKRIDREEETYYSYAYLSLENPEKKALATNFFFTGDTVPYVMDYFQKKEFVEDAVLSYKYCSSYRRIVENLMIANSENIYNNLRDAILTYESKAASTTDNDIFYVSRPWKISRGMEVIQKESFILKGAARIVFKDEFADGDSGYSLLLYEKGKGVVKEFTVKAEIYSQEEGTRYMVVNISKEEFIKDNRKWGIQRV